MHVFIYGTYVRLSSVSFFFLIFLDFFFFFFTESFRTLHRRSRLHLASVHPGLRQTPHTRRILYVLRLQVKVPAGRYNLGRDSTMSIWILAKRTVILTTRKQETQQRREKKDEKNELKRKKRKSVQKRTRSSPGVTFITEGIYTAQ